MGKSVRTRSVDSREKEMNGKMGKEGKERRRDQFLAIVPSLLQGI